MWWPLGTAGIEAPAHLGELPSLPPAIDTGRFRFRPIACDIEQLNRCAIERADLDITAMSFATYAHVADSYILTTCGASFGEGYGPKVLTRPDASAAIPSGIGDRIAHLAELLRDGMRIAIPGARTTAYLVLQLMLREAGLAEMPQDAVVSVPFDRVIPELLVGKVAAALVIHEAQVTYAASGLELLVDLGAWWSAQTGGLPLPLGANAIRRDLDTRYGPGTVAQVAAILRASIAHALAHRGKGLAYAGHFAGPEGGPGSPTPADLDRFVGLYVNELSVECGSRGRAAIEHLLQTGREAGFITRSVGLDLA